MSDKEKEIEDKKFTLPDGEFNWDIVEKMVQSDTGLFLFTKGPRTRVQLLWSPTDKANGIPPFIEVESNYRGKVKSKFMVLVLDVDGDPKSEEDPRIRGLVMTKTVLKSIKELGREGYPLMGENCHVLAVLRDQGPPVRYTVNASPKVRPIPASVLQVLPEYSVAKIAEEYTAWSNSRQNSQSDFTDEHE